MKRKVVLLAAGLILALGGVATSSALIAAGDSKTATGSVDAGLILDWGEGGTTSSLASISYGSPVTQELVVAAPVKSSGVTGYAAVGFSITNAGLIQVDVSDEAWNDGVTADFTIDSLTPSHTDYVDLATFSAAKTYYLRYSLTASPEEGASIDAATITFSLDYSETNA